ncbi:MAG: hypothetical protein R2698_10275 [Microthrixaceae bacterium]
MSSDAHIHVVLDYFDGCNTGELEHLQRTLDTDVVHNSTASLISVAGT